MLYATTNPHGGEVYSHPVEIDFSANINPYGTPQAVLDAAAGAMRLISQYPDPYCRELVQAIADFEAVPRDCILCGNGAAELIYAFCAARKPRKALLPIPSFSEYETALKSVGCAAEYYSLQEADAFALTEGFLSLLSGWDGDLLMLCNPNNPTGQVIPSELMARIAEICQEKNIFLFVDECFLDLTEGGEALSLKPALSGNPHLLLLKAFTKSYGMAGLRLGYCLCADGALLRAMGESTQAWNVSIPAQAAGIAALTQTEFLARANELIRQQRPILVKKLTELGFTVIPSRTNFILFHADRELRSPLLKKGIQIRSCDNYPGLGSGWYRVAVKLPEQNRRLCNALEEILNG